MTSISDPDKNQDTSLLSRGSPLIEDVLFPSALQAPPLKNEFSEDIHFARSREGSNDSESPVTGELQANERTSSASDENEKGVPCTLPDRLTLDCISLPSLPFSRSLYRSMNELCEPGPSSKPMSETPDIQTVETNGIYLSPTLKERRSLSRHSSIVDPGDQASDLEQEDNCHQCRARNVYAKMQCTNMYANGTVCQLFYCHKCISRR